METVPVILGVMRIILGFLLLVGIPGFAISLVIFPRLTDTSRFDRLVYSAVLGITSAIAFMVFMDVVPGLEPTLENLTLVAGVFSAGVLMLWLCERWYLNRRLTKHPEPQISEDSLSHQRYSSREINAAKNQFRQEIRGDRQILRSSFDAVSEKPRGTAVTTPEIPQRPEVSPVVQPRDKTRRPVILPSVQHEQIHGDSEGQIWVATTAMLKRPAIQTGVEPKTIPTRPEVQPRIQSKKNMTTVEYKIEVASIRKLQKNILRDLNMFDLTPDSFKRSQKIIDTIRIPKKADVNKKLSEAEEEMLDLNWLYE